MNCPLTEKANTGVMPQILGGSARKPKTNAVPALVNSMNLTTSADASWNLVAPHCQRRTARPSRNCVKKPEITGRHRI